MKFDRKLIPAGDIVLDTSFVLNNPERFPHSREDGYHAAAICKNAAIKLGLENWEESPVWENEASRAKFSNSWTTYMGLIWEAAIVQSIPGVVWQPTPGSFLQLDNYKIYGSPDGMSVCDWTNLPGQILTGHECKYTKSSSKEGFFEKAHTWHWQTMLYGQPEMLDTRFWVFHVMHINGMYEKFKFGQEQYIQYWVEYSQEEMDGIRKLVKDYLDGSELKVKTSARLLL